ncbi:hypothetical protein [Flavobacterium anhuiense]|uniref:hypothetical protein n=1 Tax=Flavobacterium anhuiense TaxID=459526 RepID=UPI0020262E9E|nr:hypothetical protein [Flavobacterium anhuiense]URM35126.1 hypothetical protein LLY39_11735 [Flavobacterium anhuiense]
MKKILCLLSAVAFVFASCSKDDSSDSTSSVLVKKIIDIDIDGSSSTRDYEYNGNKIVSMTEDGLLSKYTYTGDYITKIEEFDTEGKVDLTTEYTYTNGKLTTSIEKNTGAKYYYKTTYVHNADGTVSYDNFRGTVETGVEQEYGATGRYTLKDGNLIKLEVSYYGDERSYLYEYDAKNNPFKNVIGLNLLLEDETIVNNIVKKTEISGSGTNIHTTLTTYTYKYDANNFPTEKVESYQSGSYVSTQTTQFVY